MPRFRTTDNGKGNRPLGQHRTKDPARNRVTEALTRNFAILQGRAPNVAPPTYATWSTTDRGTGFTLSGGDLTCVVGQTEDGIRSTVGKTSGKWYWEWRQTTAPVNAVHRCYVGIARANASLSDADSGNAGVLTYHGGNGANYPESDTNEGLGFTWALNAIVSVLLDCDAGTVSWYVNGVLQRTRALPTGSSGAYHFMIAGPSTGVNINVSTTVNFGASAFSYPAIPAGASANAGLF